MRKPASIRSLVFEQKVILGLSLPLVALLVLCSAVGLLYPAIYTTSSANWLTQTVVQDGIDLFIVAPLLIVAALYSFQGIKSAIIMWGGTVSYLVYTFLIYCFSVRFNMLFLGYCCILGLSVFSMAWFFLTQVRHPIVTRLRSSRFVMVIGIYFITIATSFYVLWLLDVIPASITQTTPNSLIGIDLLTNPVQVIDLSVFLPLIFISGLLTIKAKPLASILVPVVLVFLILMDITVAALTVVLVQEGFGGNMIVAMTMAGLGLFTFGLLIWFVIIARDELSN
jgi:hypothetical protein